MVRSRPNGRSGPCVTRKPCRHSSVAGAEGVCGLAGSRAQEVVGEVLVDRLAGIAYILYLALQIALAPAVLLKAGILSVLIALIQAGWLLVGVGLASLMQNPATARVINVGMSGVLVLSAILSIVQ